MELLERFLNLSPATLPRISPDGNRLAFIKTDENQAQIWIASANEFSEPQQITDGQDLTILDWTADGRFIAFTSDLKGDERQGYYLVSPDGKEKKTLFAPDDSYRIWGGFSPDGKRFSFAANRAGTFDFSVYIQEIESGAKSQVHRGNGGIYPVSWHPNGNALLLLQIVAADANEVVYLDLESGEVEILLAPLESSYHNFFSWKKDGGGFFLATNSGRDFGGLGFFDLRKKEFSWRETPARDVENTVLSPGGKYLAWFENNEGYSKLQIENLETNETITPENLPQGVIYEIRWAKEAEKLAIELTSPQIAGDVWIYAPDTKDLFRATVSEESELKTGDFVFPETATFPAHDGEPIHGFLYLPQKPENLSPPVIIHLHGGPTMQARPKFDAFHQFLIQKGFAIFDLNYRGSTGYGKRFMRLDNQLLRKNAVRDIASAAEFLAEKVMIDRKKIALLGESYGGFMVLAGLVNFPEMFVCGIDVVGVSDWLTALENTLPQLMASDAAEYGDLNDKQIKEFLYELSPINHIEKIRTPLLLIHGENDPRVPVEQARDIAERLEKQGGKTELLVFEDEGHSISKQQNRLTAYRKTYEFLTEHFAKI